MRVRIGVHPTRLPEIVTGIPQTDAFAKFRLTKLPKNDDVRRHRYADVRTVKPCRAPLYSRALARGDVRQPPASLRTELNAGLFASSHPSCWSAVSSPEGRCTE